MKNLLILGLVLSAAFANAQYSGDRNGRPDPGPGYGRDRDRDRDWDRNRDRDRDWDRRDRDDRNRGRWNHEREERIVRERIGDIKDEIERVRCSRLSRWEKERRLDRLEDELRRLRVRLHQLD